MKLLITEEVTETNPSPLPIGTAVLDLRNAVARLERAMTTGMPSDVVISRAHLADMLRRFEVSAKAPNKGQPEIIATWLTVGQMSAEAAKTLLVKASEGLSAQLKAVSRKSTAP